MEDSRHKICTPTSYLRRLLPYRCTGIVSCSDGRGARSAIIPVREKGRDVPAPNVRPDTAAQTEVRSHGRETNEAAGLPEGAWFIETYMGQPYDFQISYFGHTGNDVILTAVDT